MHIPEAGTRCFYTKAVLKNFANFRGKQLCQTGFELVKQNQFPKICESNKEKDPQKEFLDL